MATEAAAETIAVASEAAAAGAMTQVEAPWIFDAQLLVVQSSY